MARQWYVIDFFLILALSFLTAKYFGLWGLSGSGSKEALFVSATSKAEANPVLRTEEAVKVKERIPETTYKVIADKNIFHPDRKEFAIPLPPSLPPEAKKLPARPALALYGVVIGGEFQEAIVKNPARQPGEREMMTVTVGDKIGGYRVANISPERITLETPGDSFEVWLGDPARPKPGKVISTPSAVTRTSQPAPTPVVPPPRTIPAPGAVPAPSIVRPGLPTPLQNVRPSAGVLAPQPQVRTVPPPAIIQPEADGDEDDMSSESGPVYEYTR